MGRTLQRSEIVGFQDSLYFSVGVDDTDDQELWRFDGEQVELVEAGFVAKSETSLGGFTEFQGSLYFRGDNGVSGEELYRFDGDSVSLVADVQPGDGSSSPVGLTVHEDALYFSAQVGDSFSNLMRYDGSEVTQVAGFDNPRFSVVMGSSFAGDLYFGADDGIHGMELWKYDGERAALVSDISPGNSASFPRDFTPVGDKLAFRATTPEVGQEIFQYDGESVSLLVDTNPGPRSSDSGYLTEHEGELYFSALAWRSRFLYRTQGDRVEKVMPGGGPIDLGNGELATIRGRRKNGVEVNELYHLDGSFFRSTVPSAGAFAALNENLYFGCECPIRELFRLAKAGDTNADGIVDFQDFMIVSNNFGQTGAWESGDFTNDGKIAFSDFLALSENFGVESEPGHVMIFDNEDNSALLNSSSSVPEPEPFSAIWLLVLAAWGRRRIVSRAKD